MRSPLFLAAWTALLGAAVSFGVFRSVRDGESRSIAARFHGEARAERDAVQSELDRRIAVLDSIRSLHDLSDRISSRDLEEFVAKGMRYQAETLVVFGFAERLHDDDRETFEKSPLGGQKSPATIWESRPGGGFQPAARRDVYLPILYVTPEQGLGVPVGFDLASIPANRAALQRMTQSPRPVLGAAWSPDGVTEARLIFSPILIPIYKEEEKAFLIYPRGVAFGLLVPADVLRSALGEEPRPHLRIVLTPAGADADRPDPNVPLVFEDVVHVADETWSFRVLGAPAYAEALRTRYPASLLAAGIIVSLLLAALVHVIAGRARRTEELVRHRTRQLREAQAAVLEAAAGEQQRLGRDLHDSLGQKLTGAVFLSRSLIEESGPAAREQAQKLNEVLKEAVAQTRHMARGLSPVEIGEEGLANALRRLADETTEVFGVACSFRGEGAPTVSAAAATHLYQVAQEAVTNAIRHGSANEVSIRLTESGLAVEDNGKGFDPRAESAGAGLRIMRYRAEMAGGELNVESKPGRTLVTCRLTPA